MEVIMPKMGESINEGTIIKWYKKVGDSVKQDEIIFEISTDKVDTEIPSPGNGVLKEIKFKEGDTVEVGVVVAVIEADGEVSVPIQKEEPEETVKEIKKTVDKIETPLIDADVEQQKVQTLGASKEVEVIMPKMGESVMEGTVLKWHKKAGDKIEKDEILFEISTDKVDTEVPSPEAGVVSEILIAEQETVAVGTVVQESLRHDLP